MNISTVYTSSTNEAKVMEGKAMNYKYMAHVQTHIRTFSPVHPLRRPRNCIHTYAYTSALSFIKLRMHIFGCNTLLIFRLKIEGLRVGLGSII